MKVETLALHAWRRRLRGGVNVRFGPFTTRIDSRLPVFASQSHAFYGPYPILPDDVLVDFRVSIHCPTHRRWWRPQAWFTADGQTPYAPMRAGLALPVFEWGLNWCIAMRAHNYLMLHAAVLARGEDALILPGVPGAGKSTLCAALAQSGWRLLSDEFTLLDPHSLSVTALARPVSLKNDSIELLRTFAPQAHIGPRYPKTHKGTVAHMRPPVAHIDAMDAPAKARWVVFPKWAAGSRTHVRPVRPDEAFLGLCSSSFNYELRGADGFRAVAALVKTCAPARLDYDALADGVAALDALA